MRVMSAGTINELYETWRFRLNQAPVIEVRGQKTKELVDCCSVLTDPWSCVLQDEKAPYYAYALKELLLYLKGSQDVNDAAKASSFWKKVHEHGKINSNYGYHVFFKPCPTAHSQFEWCIRELQHDMHSRKCVVVINSLEHKNGIEKDFPCTMFYQFMIRQNDSGKHALSMSSFMRSNDLVYGFRYDVFWESILLILLWHRLRDTYPLLQLGTVAHTASSLHLYMKDWEAA